MGRMGVFEDGIPCVGGKIRIVKHIELVWTEMSQTVFFTIGIVYVVMPTMNIGVVDR